VVEPHCEISARACTDVFSNVVERHGKVDGSEVTGTFEGLFTSRELTDRRQSGTPYVDRYCSAKDHRFRFVWQ